MYEKKKDEREKKKKEMKKRRKNRKGEKKNKKFDLAGDEAGGIRHRSHLA